MPNARGNHNHLPDAETILSWWNEKPEKSQGLDLRFIPNSVKNVPKFLIPIAKKFLKIKELSNVFYNIPSNATALEFSRKAFEVMDVKLETSSDFYDNIPTEGPLIVVSNHPFGGIDGLAFLAAILAKRPDFYMLINMFLGIFPQLRPNSLPLDIFSGNATSFAINSSSLKAANTILSNGGAIGIFPSGVVSNWQKGKGVVDPEWQITAARLAKRNKCSVLPIFFQGGNSKLFNLAGMVHPSARTFLLPREFYNMCGQTIRVSSGKLIEPNTLEVLNTPESFTAYLRMRCYVLKNNLDDNSSSEDSAPLEPIAEPHTSEELEKSLLELPKECFLLKEGDFSIYAVKGSMAPVLLEEVGRLREFTFRQIGQGSGKSRDLDPYDKNYYHLLLWSDKDKFLVGAYRLGKIQELLEEEGTKGVYTTTLFNMDNRFFELYSESLELGRAVIHPNYQREYFPLMLLWKGIGRFVFINKDIRCLFGPVSLSLEYNPSSLKTVIEYLKTQCGDDNLASLVKGKTKPNKLLKKADKLTFPDSVNYNNVASLIKDIEGGKGIPILFKHYLKLGGKIGAFHLDTDFKTLDAFLLMDLTKSPKIMLERYMTPEGAKEFLERWEE